MSSSVLREGTLTNPYELMGFFFCFHTPQKQERINDPGETDTTIITDYVFLLRDGEQPVRVEHDQHITGLFSREQWLSILKACGFRVSFVIDPFDRHVFIAWKESSSSMESGD